jgi:hypothetical protein
VSTTYDPGWFPDPTGLWELRWWNGTEWTPAVATGNHQDTDPVPPPDAAYGALPEGTPDTLWTGENKSGFNTTRYWLTPHELVIDGGPNAGRLPLWSIHRVDVRAPQPVADVELTIAYEGYGGRTTYVLRQVPDAHRVKALIWKYTQLAKRRAVLTAPPPPPPAPPPPAPPPPPPPSG